MTDFALEPPDVADLKTMQIRGKWPKTLAEFMDTLESAFRKDGVPPEQAAQLAECGVLALAWYQGGSPFYLPNMPRLRHAARNRRIFIEWNGRNEEELMRRYNLGSKRRLEQIIAEQSAIHIRRIQPDLFPSDAAD